MGRSSVLNLRDTWPGLFGPHIVLPSQLRGREVTELSGERRLLVAVLEAAIEDYQRTHQSQHASYRRRHREVEAWLASNSEQWLFSFVRICDALGLSAAYLRAGLATWAASGKVYKPDPRTRQRPHAARVPAPTALPAALREHRDLAAVDSLDDMAGLLER
jgi:hypothetical protein